MAVQLGGLSINNPLAITPNTASAPAPAAHAPASPGVFWKGADGNVWVKGAGGTHAAGQWDNNTQHYWGSRGFGMINDPNAPKQTSTTNNGAYGSSTTNTTGTGSGSSTQYEDKSNDITLQNAGLGAVGNTETSGIKAIEDAWNKINGEYNDDLNTASTAYNNETTDNNKDLQTNKQTALERGVQGRQGLFGTLASIGALNGTGIDLANRAVQAGTNEDLTTAGNTHATNQNALDTSYNTYKKEEERLQSQAQTAKANNEQQVHNDAARSRQQYLTNLANDYQAEGNTAEAKNYASQAAALFPSIAATNVPTINLGYSGGTYAAPTLSQYAGKANNTVVQTTPGANIPGNTFSIPGLVALNKKSGA